MHLAPADDLRRLIAEEHVRLEDQIRVGHLDDAQRHPAGRWREALAPGEVCCLGGFLRPGRTAQ